MAVAKFPGHPLILAGKSLGSRKGMEQHEMQLTVPIMFVQELKGSKDGLCPLDKLDAVRERLASTNALYVVEGGDHSLKITQKHLLATETTQDYAEKSAVNAIASFVSSCLYPGG